MGFFSNKIRFLVASIMKWVKLVVWWDIQYWYIYRIKSWTARLPYSIRWPTKLKSSWPLWTITVTDHTSSTNLGWWRILPAWFFVLYYLGVAKYISYLALYSYNINNIYIFSEGVTLYYTRTLRGPISDLLEMDFEIDWIPRLRTVCCGFSLKTATKIVAIFELVGAIWKNPFQTTFMHGHQIKFL